jgi:LmbE family N-acetylglucosaminyl deacetylase
MEPFPDGWQRALCVVAHPDDLEYGVASAVARWTGEGRSVTYALATSGEAGIDGLEPAACAALREDEERASASIVGVDDVRFLGHADGLVEYGIALRRDLARVIRAVRPDVVLTIHFDLTWGDGGSVNHADHRAVGLATIDAVRDAANRWLFRDDGEPWSGVEGVYVAATPNPTHVVDVTPTIERGVASLRAHRAYIDGLGNDFDPDAFLRGMAQSAGRDAGVEYAVAFRRFEA